MSAKATTNPVTWKNWQDNSSPARCTATYYSDGLTGCYFYDERECGHHLSCGHCGRCAICQPAHITILCSAPPFRAARARGYLIPDQPEAGSRVYSL